jgi:hypothetical protein
VCVSAVKLLRYYRSWFMFAFTLVGPLSLTSIIISTNLLLLVAHIIHLVYRSPSSEHVLHSDIINHESRLSYRSNVDDIECCDGYRCCHPKST